MTVGTRAQVFHGTADRTAGGLIKKDFKLKDGRIISKKQSAAGKKNPGLKKWRTAVSKAKCQLDMPKKGQFVLIKGKLLNRSKEIMRCS
jgi:hypothetical protein